MKYTGLIIKEIPGRQALFMEQLGYGFTAFTFYVLYVSAVKHKTIQYTFGAGILAPVIMLPGGMISGWLQEVFGYQYFFIGVINCTIPCFIGSKQI